MRLMKLTTSLLVASALVLSGCIKKEPSKAEMFTAYVMGTDSTSVNVDPSTDFEKYVTFSIVDPESSPNNQLAGLAGMGPKRVIQDIMEQKGFELAPEGTDPHLLVSVSGNLNQTTSVVSGGTGVLPMWNPGQTYTINSSSTVFGGLNTYTGNTFGTVTGSGTTSWVPYKQPDQIVTRNLASILIQVHDYKIKKELISFRASAQSFSSDASTATQVLLDSFMGAGFRNRANDLKLVGPYLPDNPGSVGSVAILRSVNPTTMLPRVAGIVKGGAMHEAGIRVGDFIVSVNGKPSANKTAHERLKAFKGKKLSSAGDTLVYEILRDDEVQEFNVKLKPLVIN